MSRGLLVYPHYLQGIKNRNKAVKSELCKKAAYMSKVKLEKFQTLGKIKKITQ